MKKKKCEHLKSINQSIFFDSRGFVKPLRPRNSNKLPFDAKDIYISFSRKGVFRGLHVQLGKFPPNKIVSIIHGSLIAVSVCCNKQCRNFGQITIKKLASETSKALLIPKLQAFGYLTLENNTLVATCIDQEYSETDERGINPNSFKKVIKFSGKFKISKKDRKWPELDEFLNDYRDT